VKWLEHTTIHNVTVLAVTAVTIAIQIVRSRILQLMLLASADVSCRTPVLT